MLVLTRSEGEALVIGEDIEIHVISIKGGQVKIGIDAPRNISVNRKEIRLKPNSLANGNK